MSDKYAFARPNSDGAYENEEPGLTVRQYYAAKAMQGMLANAGMVAPDLMKRIAVSALAMADALVEAEKN